jgi:hypothetical protein
MLSHFSLRRRVSPTITRDVDRLLSFRIMEYRFTETQQSIVKFNVMQGRSKAGLYQCIRELPS